MRPLKTITPRYAQAEDRILLVVNAGDPNSWGGWLTRRLVLDLLGRVQPFLDSTSAALTKTPLEHRGELRTMQQEVALASTQGSISRTPVPTVAQAAVAAELVTEINIGAEAKGFRLRFRSPGGEAGGLCSRQQLQRIVHMIQQEADKAGWRGAPAPVPVQTAADAAAAAAARKRQAN